VTNLGTRLTFGEKGIQRLKQNNGTDSVHLIVIVQGRKIDFGHWLPIVRDSSVGNYDIESAGDLLDHFRSGVGETDSSLTMCTFRFFAARLLSTTALEGVRRLPFEVDQPISDERSREINNARKFEIRDEQLPSNTPCRDS